MLGFLIKKPKFLPEAKWALKTSVNDYSWVNSNPHDMIEISISTAETKTSHYQGYPPKTVCGTVISALVGDTPVHSSAPVGVKVEVASIATVIPELEFSFGKICKEDFSLSDTIVIPAQIESPSERELSEFEKLFNKYTHSYMERGAAAQTTCASVFLDILTRLDAWARADECIEKKDKYISYYAAKAKSIINMRYCENITLRSVAEELGITPGYLSTVYKKSNGISFSGGLFEKRISEARELVCKTNLSVAEIAERTGLGDESNLRRRFKQHFGTGIREYRSVIKEQTLYLEKPTRNRSTS